MQTGMEWNIPAICFVLYLELAVKEQTKFDRDE